MAKRIAKLKTAIGVRKSRLKLRIESTRRNNLVRRGIDPTVKRAAKKPRASPKTGGAVLKRPVTHTTPARKHSHRKGTKRHSHR